MADLIVAIIDNSSDLTKEDDEILNIIKDKKAIILLNKVDIKKENEKINKKIKILNKPILKISAKNGEGIDHLYKEIIRLFNLNEISNDKELLITNERHKNQIKKAIKLVEQADCSVKDNMPIDIVSINLKEALESLGEITGKNVTENVIDEIFARFCLGK